MKIESEIRLASTLVPGDLFIPIPAGLPEDVRDEFIAGLLDVKVAAIGVSLYTGMAWGENIGPTDDDVVIVFGKMEFD